MADVLDRFLNGARHDNTAGSRKSQGGKEVALLDSTMKRHSHPIISCRSGKLPSKILGGHDRIRMKGREEVWLDLKGG